MIYKLILGLFACCVAGIAIAAPGDSYPARPITLIVPFTPGGGTDIVGRLVAEKLTTALGKPVVVDNRPGAGGTIGTDLAAHAEPNGYTLMIGSVSTISINPSLYKNLSTNPIKDLAPISLVASTPSMIAVPIALPVNSVQELIAWAKKNPGKLNYGSAGVGTSHHLSGELFKMRAGIEATHVPYKGSAPALLALIRGDIHLLIANVPSLTSAIEGKQIKVLAVTSLERSPQFPQLPTVSESGLPGFEVIVWYGIFAPAGTPTAIINRLNSEIKKIAAMPDVKKRLLAEGAKAISSSPEEFEQRILKDYATWKKVVEVSGARLD